MMPKSLIISMENLSTGHGKKQFCYHHEVVLSMTMLISICRQCHKYGPIYDNVSGSIDMTNMNHEVSKTTNALNVVGNIIIIIGKVGHCCFSGSCCCHLLQMISTKLFLELML
jgi:Na+/H+-translocating membrane pyrophosphatase